MGAGVGPAESTLFLPGGVPIGGETGLLCIAGLDVAGVGVPEAT